MPSSAKKPRVAKRDAAAARPCRIRPCRRESRSRRVASAMLRSCAAATMAAARGMLACPLEAGRQPQELGFIEAARWGDGGDRRLAFGQRAGLVDDQRVDLLHAFERLGVLDQHAGLRATSDADHDRHRRGQTERARAGDDQTRDRGDQCIAEPRLWPEQSAQATKRQRRATAMTAGTNQPRHLVGETLDRRARALRLRDHLHDLRQQRIAADLGRRASRTSRIWLSVPAMTMAPGVFRDRHGLAGDHRLRRRRTAFDHLAIDRDFFARPHPQAVADLDGIERYVLARCRRCRGVARSSGRDRAARGSRRRCLAGAQFQHLSEQHQHRDDRRGLEIDRHRAVMSARTPAEKARARASRPRCRGKPTPVPDARSG